jgi:hypothetical protein
MKAMTGTQSGGESVIVAGLVFVGQFTWNVIGQLEVPEAAVNGIVAAVSGYIVVELIKYVRKKIEEKWLKKKAEKD